MVLYLYRHAIIGQTHAIFPMATAATGTTKVPLEIPTLSGIPGKTTHHPDHSHDDRLIQTCFGVINFVSAYKA